MSKIVDFLPRIDCPTNEARIEWLFCCMEGLPPARKKRLIVIAAMEEVGFLTPGEAHMLLSSLGLEAS